jgi:hypothetical protein
LSFTIFLPLSETSTTSSSDSDDNPKKIIGLFGGSSTTVKVINFTNGQLKLTSKNLSGSWDPPPPDNIPPSDHVQWKSKSKVLGTEGSVIYQSDHGPISIHWDNPTVKSNVYSIHCPKEYQCNYSGGTGTDAVVTFNVGKI